MVMYFTYILLGRYVDFIFTKKKKMYMATKPKQLMINFCPHLFRRKSHTYVIKKMKMKVNHNIPRHMIKNANASICDRLIAHYFINLCHTLIC